MNVPLLTRRRLFLVALVFGAFTSALADYDLARSTIDGGGVMQSSGGGYVLSGTIGQSDASQMNGGSYALNGGFWYEEPIGDCDATGIVDLLDHADLSECLAGPGSGLSEPACNCFDFDDDDDTDLLDFAEFQAIFAG